MRASGVLDEITKRRERRGRRTDRSSHQHHRPGTRVDRNSLTWGGSMLFNDDAHYHLMKDDSPRDEP